MSAKLDWIKVASISDQKLQARLQKLQQIQREVQMAEQAFEKDAAQYIATKVGVPAGCKVVFAYRYGFAFAYVKDEPKAKSNQIQL